MDNINEKLIIIGEILKQVKTDCDKPNLFSIQKKMKDLVKIIRKLRDNIKKFINKSENLETENLTVMDLYLTKLVDILVYICNGHLCHYKLSDYAENEICENLLYTIKSLKKENDFLLSLSKMELGSSMKKTY